VVTFAEGSSEGASESLLLSGVRSALCAPIFVRGRPQACFYATHRQVSGLFGADEQRLAEFIATIAGAALENTAGFNQLRELNETLEQRVAERSAAVEARSRELARSNADLEEFAYAASHDLQEPLRAVSGYCEFLRRNYHDRLDERAHEYINNAVDGAQRMSALIRDLLEYSRVARKADPFAPTDFDPVVQQALERLKVAVEESGAKIHCDKLPTLRADQEQQIRLFQNLIGNAIKFRGRDPLEVWITAEQKPGGQGDWLFRVRDNGIGIDPKYKERIFMIFQRLHTREEYPGTGIGLAVCKRIVERHGGRIWVESSLGQGSAFCFTLAQTPQDSAGVR
jgi:light-regulated signal transduction histidine kinase (bacteriophytochrome)